MCALTVCMVLAFALTLHASACLSRRARLPGPGWLPLRLALLQTTHRVMVAALPRRVLLDRSSLVHLGICKAKVKSSSM